MFTFVAEPDEGEQFTFTAKSRDVVAWEKSAKGRSLGELQRAMKFSELYGLAHVAARRLGLFTGSLEEFEKTVDLKVVPEEEADPTQPTR